MTLPFRPNCQPMILSPLPHDNPRTAWAAVAQWTPALPVLPLLAPKSESLARVTADGFAGAEMNSTAISIDRATAINGLDTLYANYLRGTAPAHSMGLVSLPHVVVPEQSAIRRAQALGATVLGPMSLALLMIDDQAVPVLDSEELLDALGKHVYLRQRWLHGALARSGKPVLVWVYEPYLQATDSALSPAQFDSVIGALDQALGSDVPRALWLGDFAAALRLPEFMRIDALAMALPAPEAAATAAPLIARLLASKTAFGWGIVPAASEGLANATAGKLAARFGGWLRALEAAGVPIPELLAGSLIMPEDTLVYLTSAEAERAMTLTAELASLIRQSYGVD